MILFTAVFQTGRRALEEILILFSFGAGRGSQAGTQGERLRATGGGRGGAGGPLWPALVSLSLVGGLPRKVFLTVGLLVN